MASFHLITIVLLSIFLPQKQSEGQYLTVVMHPNEDDQVLEVGATLILTCTVETKIPINKFITEAPFNIWWTLPDYLIKQLVGNTFTLMQYII